MSDKDTSFDNGRVNCTMTDPSFRFLRRSDGKYQLITTTALDREKRDSYNLRVICQDRGSPPLSSVRDIPIAVIDDNDNTPVFDKPRYETTIFERNYEGVTVLRVNATDLDIGRNREVTYSVPEHVTAFQIDHQSGVIRAMTSLDREKAARLTFDVYAIDGGVNPRTATAEVTIIVQDVNDEKPQFLLPVYLFVVAENSKPDRVLGNVSAIDEDTDPNNLITYSLVLTGSSIGLFRIHPTSGLISLARSPDREIASVHYFTAVARDSGSPPLSGTTSVAVTISDVNDNAPVFQFPSGLNSSLVIPNNYSPGYVVRRIEAMDADLGENGKVRYAISGGNDHDYFSVDAEYGALIINVDLSHVVYETITLELIAKDNGQPSLSTSAVLVVIINKSLATTTTASQTGGRAYALLAGHNLTVMLVLVALTVFVLLLLVITILCLKRNDRRRKAFRYNCRVETIKALTSTNSSGSMARDAVCVESLQGHSGQCTDGACDRLLIDGRCAGDYCDDRFIKVRRMSVDKFT